MDVKPRRIPWAALLPLTMVLMGAEARTVVEERISGVVDVGTPIVLVKNGFEGSEGPLPQQDGSILFTENRAGRIVRLAPDGTSAVWMATTSGANALAFSPIGEVVAALTGPAGIGVLKAGAEPRVLVRDYQGQPFNRPNDIIVGRSGVIYFTDPASPAPAGAPPKVSAVYMLTPAGELTRIAEDIGRPNGIALSPDQRRLYVDDTAGPNVYSFSLDKAGKPGAKNVFAQLRMPSSPEAVARGSGADGMAVDDKGRLYVATTAGVQVFTARGKEAGIIAIPVTPQNLAFAGPGKRSTLFVVGQGNVYTIAMKSRGPHRSGK